MCQTDGVSERDDSVAQFIYLFIYFVSDDFRSYFTYVSSSMPCVCLFHLDRYRYAQRVQFKYEIYFHFSASSTSALFYFSIDQFDQCSIRAHKYVCLVYTNSQ